MLNERKVYGRYAEKLCMDYTTKFFLHKLIQIIGYFISIYMI